MMNAADFCGHPLYEPGEWPMAVLNVQKANTIASGNQVVVAVLDWLFD